MSARRKMIAQREYVEARFDPRRILKEKCANRIGHPLNVEARFDPRRILKANFPYDGLARASR